jgi:HlyD family secretion protein
MARLRRVILPLLVLAVLVTGLVLSLMPRPVSVDIAPVTTGPITVSVREDGRTRVKERYVVFSPLGGRLERIPHKAGASITAAQTLLAAIEPSDPELLDARAVAEAEARVKAAKAAIRRADTEVAATNAALEFATEDLARMLRSERDSAATAREVQDARVTVTLRTEAARSATFARDIAAFELEQAEAALIRTRPSQPAGNDDAGTQFRIVAPIDGAVLRVLRESAGFVAAGTPLLEIGDSTDLEVEVDVLSEDAVRIAPGARVLIEDWGGPRPIESRVRLVEPSAFTKISALGVEEQRVNIIIDFAEPMEGLPPLGDGYRVQARIVIDEAADVLLVPTGALFRHGGAWAAFVLADGRAARRELEIGRRNDTVAEVLSGLAAGDRVVLYPSDRVVDGVKLHPRN